MTRPAIPEQFSDILIDPEAWLTILQDSVGNPINEAIRPIDMLDDGGAR